MEDNERRLTIAFGEATFAGLSQAALWLMLVGNGTINPAQAIETLDRLLLSFERERGRDPSIDHARSRLEYTIDQIRRIAAARAAGSGAATTPGA